MDDYFESNTIYGNDPRVEPGDERTAAQETSRSWELRYLEDDALVVDSESANRVGGEMAAREQRVQELETELQRIRVERLRDQESVDRLKHELADRNSRLERALSKTQELAAIMQGGHLR